jgi:hypothetical protein
MADTGYEEAGSGDFVKECVNHLTAIAGKSQYESSYISYFVGLRKGIDSFGSHPDTKKEVQKWLDASIAALEKT